ncbi:helix-hairpin-helix domain-containing protein [Humidisolicoccus flavus]|uniref:helix-hairpin-helix domain-containing protein n=1 Tax=Humidisolicoccus flavus TaxID=3111414 RepID=UPI003243EA96
MAIALKPRWRLGIGAAIVLAVGASVGAVLSGMAPQPSVSEVVLEPSPTTASALVVDVQGAVNTPGVYVLASGDRVLDAIEAAGGLRDDAVSGAENLARVLVDGEQILIPVVGEATGSIGTGGAGAGVSGSGKVSINRADAVQFETLPGIGPALAAAIVQHRDEHGPFASVEALDDVPGIGPSILSKVAELVTL